MDEERLRGGIHGSVFVFFFLARYTSPIPSRAEGRDATGGLRTVLTMLKVHRRRSPCAQGWGASFCKLLTATTEAGALILAGTLVRVCS